MRVVLPALAASSIPGSTCHRGRLLARENGRLVSGHESRTTRSVDLATQARKKPVQHRPHSRTLPESSGTSHARTAGGAPVFEVADRLGVTGLILAALMA